MIKEFKVKNYKNFAKELTFNFDNAGGYKFNDDCLIEGCIGKSIIYGRNATGKTNLGEAISDIRQVLFGIANRRRSNRILNADSDEECVYFDYIFKFSDDIVEYKYTRNEDGCLMDEELILNERIIFSFSWNKKIFSTINLGSISSESLQVDKYITMIKEGITEEDDSVNREWNNTPFLRYVLANTALEADSVLIKLQDYISRMRYTSVAEQMSARGRALIFDQFNSELGNKVFVEDFQDFLNAMGISCRLKTLKKIDGQYELFFDHKTPVPFFENASSGTISLTNFYRRYIAPLRNPSFIFMDEFDAFFHYEMAEKLVLFLKKRYTRSQVVLTTHNTVLMNNQLMRPDCLFILSGNNALTSLRDATPKELREGHNLEKMYISGEFEKYE